MSTDFAPRPGAASLPRRVAAQSLMEARLMLRNGEQLLLALAIPVLVLVGGVFAARRMEFSWAEDPVDVLTPGALALAVMSTAFTSLAIATGFERRAGLLRRLAVSPLSRTGLLAGKIGALLAVEFVQCLVIAAVGLGLGWRPTPAGVPVAALVAVIGTAAFTGLGLALAGTLRAEATLAAANLINVVLLAGGAVVVPRSAYGAAEGWLAALPSAALGDALRGALIDGSLPWVPIAILLGWAALGAGVAARWFRWD
jgi:ABC-2 type transport system permease protein